MDSIFKWNKMVNKVCPYMPKTSFEGLTYIIEDAMKRWDNMNLFGYIYNVNFLKIFFGEIFK